MSFLCPRAFTPSKLSSLLSTRHASSTTTQCLRAHPPTSRLPILQKPPAHFRKISTTRPRLAKPTVEEAKARARRGPFSGRAALLFLVTGACMIAYFRLEKARMDRQRIAEATKGVGKPKIGGQFELVDQEGRRFTDEDLRGGYSLVYFGFTHCPDICPDELDKLSRIIDLVAPTRRHSISTSSFVSPTSPPAPLLPIFITCDPARDTPSVLKTYLAEFHPGIVGLTGTWQQIKDVCKKYRVYFSTPEGVKPGMDYLVDHSIYFYLMDPEGDFVEAIGRQHTAEAAARIIVDHMGDWKK
ncbi:hypothetical protein JMJ35_007434 [Cladonia borealis]|uniref:Uncharacterized protein n=1 Tax=Cladonia borealis TaxID=184061 RepID=A0AA39QVQ2_9LECA|nr:hypothetical protein JMJ35_007434 [Cladonia borealis]